MNIEVQFESILIMTVVATALGALFGPYMFGKKWMKYMDHTDDQGVVLISPEKMKELQKAVGVLYTLQFLATFVMLTALSVCLTTASGLQAYIVTGFLWLGFVVPIGATDEIWSMTKSTYRLPKFLIASIYQLVVMLIATWVFLM